jgi:arylsulfatase A-like enzyme
MNGVWLILDSLSYTATPFAAAGPDTMPNYSELVREHGINFTRAYSPGPFSPSSHASFFTGELPSTAGMYEANPRFDGGLRTIGDAMSETHSTHLITTNHFLFQGLDEGFDHTDDIGRRYMLFDDASDPKDYSTMYNDDPGWKRAVDFLTREKRPIRSLLNGLNYTLGGDQWIRPESWGDKENFQYVSTMCDMIRRRLSEPDDSFVVANFMDLHGPFGVSEAALDRFFPDTAVSDIPLGKRTRRDKLRGEKAYDPDKMYGLYKAAIWDFDRKFSPFVSELLDDDTFVAVLADHGWYDTNSAYSDERLHVPLTLFVPGEEPREAHQTVSLTSLPRTTTEILQNTDGGFEGPSLLDLTTDQRAVTEVIHKPNDVYEKTRRVYVNRPVDDPAPEEIQYDIILYEGDAKVACIDGTVEDTRGPSDVVSQLEAEAKRHYSEEIRRPSGKSDGYDEQTEKRLQRLGYLE